MGSCFSSESAEEVANRKRNKEIENELKDDREKQRRECKLLLLGSGESGKSTIVKQMKIIHQNGYTENELGLYRTTVYKNLLDSIKCVVSALRLFEVQLKSIETEEQCVYIENYNLEIQHDNSCVIDPYVAVAIDAIWKDLQVQDMVQEHSSEFYLMDSAPYFFENAGRITQPKYTPNTMDVLRARTKTTGIFDTRFTMDQVNIHMFDVGGQRSERKKWIHCFENVTSIIYCVALSEYDQVLLEESSQNRMRESLLLFDSVANSRWFARSSIILFLNKFDIFQNKVKRLPLADYFPDYTGGDNPHKCAKYILWRFDQVNRRKLNLYPHITEATSTSNIRIVFVAVKETILQNALKDIGIL